MTARRAALVAALDEAERVATRVPEEYRGRWIGLTGTIPSVHQVGKYGVIADTSKAYDADARKPLAAFIAANDPAHTLRQIALSRLILAASESSADPDEAPIIVAELCKAWGIE